MIGRTVHEVRGPEVDLALSPHIDAALGGVRQHFESVRDYVSREIFERIRESEEEHVDFLETQFEMMERMGLPNYVQLHSEAAGDGGTGA